MKMYKKVCPQCGKAFETDSGKRKYCYGSCSYDAILKRRPVNQKSYKENKEKEEKRQRTARRLRDSALARLNQEARDNGMTYGQYVCKLWCEKETARRNAERRARLVGKI